MRAYEWRAASNPAGRAPGTNSARQALRNDGFDPKESSIPEGLASVCSWNRESRAWSPDLVEAVPYHREHGNR